MICGGAGGVLSMVTGALAIGQHGDHDVQPFRDRGRRHGADEHVGFTKDLLEGARG